MEELGLDVCCEAEETDGLVFDLGDQRFILVVLSRNQLSNEVFTIRLRNSIRLLIEHSRKIIMILLLRQPHLHKRQDQHSRSEKHPRIKVNPSDFLEHISILALDLFEISRYRVEAVTHILLISVASHQEQDSDDIVDGRIDGLENLFEN